MSDFWSRKLGGQQPPPHVQQPVVQQGAWWQTPVHQAPTPPQGYGQPGSGVPEQLTSQQLKSMRADQMNQDQMEMLALMELQEAKYNNVCPQCSSTDFLPAGTKVGSQKMPIDKCFHCGSSGVLTNSPETAVGATSGKAGRATKQIHGGSGSYGQHHSQLPAGYLPTR
jgi:hypothetical protein